jgi:hypothetical protein
VLSGEVEPARRQHEGKRGLAHLVAVVDVKPVAPVEYRYVSGRGGLVRLAGVDREQAVGHSPAVEWRPVRRRGDLGHPLGLVLVRHHDPVGEEVKHLGWQWSSNPGPPEVPMVK